MRVLALVLLTACGGEDKSSDSASSATPSTTTPTGTAPTGTTPAGTTPTGGTSAGTTPTGTTSTGTTSTGSTPCTDCPEDCANGVDDDDDGLIDCEDPDCLALCDADADGFAPPEDCDDTDPERHPGALEICGDGIDQDCDGVDPECARMYAADGRGGRDRAAPPRLYEIDLVTGTVEGVGTLPAPVTGLTFTDVGRLLALTAASSESAQLLELTVDPFSTTVLHTLEVEHASGFAWAVPDTTYAWVEEGDTLHTLDLATGALSEPLASGGTSGHCLAADASGQLHQLVGATLYTLDPATGSRTLVGAVDGLPSGYSGQGCTFAYGWLYVAPLDAFDPAFGERELYAVDVSAAFALPTGILLPEDLDALAAWPP
ncbi:MAG: hypothetical protein ACI8PZ_002381 [Myxococcota bacterium]|jgi:hypothetical protein